ncbi:hypothetical protein BCR44DRAFT_1194815 [Catenaria anguillulae PL171]|uniref:Uncharacterized protein n=1 Tax=Catenaria anguillulae PL171 TaxID=765915 RepID=A0A1Y2HGC2_9FUNG|nr:hypothetical protein BCR44DRAFT_1194815 [Catenaria anguillulae PL171]
MVLEQLATSSIQQTRSWRPPASTALFAMSNPVLNVIKPAKLAPSSDRINKLSAGRVPSRLGGASGILSMRGSLNAMNNRAPSMASSVSFEGSLYQVNVSAMSKGIGPLRRSPRMQQSANVLDQVQENEEDEDISVDPTSLDPFLLALSITNFQPGVFLRELMLHLLQPVVILFLPFSIRLRTLAYNRQFYGGSFLVPLQWTFMVCLIASTTVFFLDRPELIGWEEYALSVLMLVYRQAIIACKYSYTSPLELAKMEEEFETADTQYQRQVLTGWINPNRDVVETQVLLASVRQWLDLCHGHLILKSNKPGAPTPLKPVAKEQQGMQVVNDLQLRYGAYLDANNASSDAAAAATAASKSTGNSKTPSSTASPGSQHDSGPNGDSSKKRVSAWSVIVEMVMESHQCQTSQMSFRMTPLVFCILPLIVRWIMGEPVAGGTRWTAQVYTAAVFYNNYWMMTSNLGFVQICITDFRRRQFLFTRLKAMLFDGFVKVPRSAITDTSHGKLAGERRPDELNSVMEIDDESAKPASYNLDESARTATGLIVPQIIKDGGKTSDGAKSMKDRIACDPDDELVLVRLDMDHSHNLLMWWYSRLILQDYGRTFLLRLQSYSGAFILFCFKVALFLVTFAIGWTVPTPAGFSLAVVVMLTLFIQIIRVLYHGLKANRVREAHTTALYRKAITLSTRAEACAQGTQSRLKSHMTRHSCAGSCPRRQGMTRLRVPARIWVAVEWEVGNDICDVHVGRHQ